VVVTREEILDALTAALAPQRYVDAFWEGGAASWGRVDPWSDIDAYVLVEDEGVDDAFRTVEATLASLSPIDRTYTPSWPPASGIAQKFYRLERASVFLLLDLAVLKRSAPEKFLQPEVHGLPVVRFDKTGATRVPPIDGQAFASRRRERLVVLRDRFEMFGVFVDKELNRGNPLEALDAYRSFILGPLVEVLRMEHAPFHHGFGMRYVHYELPQDIVRRLEGLSFPRDLDDLRRTNREAGDWFREVSDRLAVQPR